MNKFGMFFVALISLGMVACGGGPNEEDTCGCVEEEAVKTICETVWEACDEEGGKDGKECKEELQKANGCD